MQRTSQRRRALSDMRAIFTELNGIPHETRKHWGSFGAYGNYDFFIAEIDKQSTTLDRNLRIVMKRKEGVRT